jgi:peptidyl-prolyl cis-trans isomerase SurA
VSRTRKLLALTALAGVLCVAGSRAKAAEVIERVVAVVNDDAIFLSDLRQKAAPFLSRAMNAPTEAERMSAVRTIYTQLLERMIDERLILQVAEDENITVSATEVNQGISNVRQQSQLSETDFWAAVRQQGFSPAQYRRDVRQQLVRLKVLNQHVRGRVNITEDDVRRRYDESSARARRHSVFEACYVRVALAGDGSASELHRAVQEPTAARRQIRQWSDFEALMDERRGSCTGRISEGDVAPELADVLATLEEHQVSEPVRTADAVFLLGLQSREQGTSEVPSYESVRMRVYNEMMQEAMASQEQHYLEELRRRATVTRRLEL